MSWKRREPDPPPKNTSERTKAEIEAFTDQARWLIEYHDKRGESFTTRATALLGFSGVILALILRGPVPTGIELTTRIEIAAIATVTLLIACAVACLVTLAPGPSSAPGIDEFRTTWDDWTKKKGRGKVLGNIAGSYTEPDKDGKNIPLLSARNLANRRAKAFITAAGAMLAALVSMAVLLFLIYQQIN